MQYDKTTGDVTAVYDGGKSVKGYYVGTENGLKFMLNPPFDLHKAGVLFHVDAHGSVWVKK